jgi:hypothetical protein
MKNGWMIVALALMLGCAVSMGIVCADDEEGEEAPVAEPATHEAPAVAAEPAAQEQLPAAGEQAKEEAPAGSYLKNVGRKLSCGATNVARAGTEFYVQPMDAKRVSGTNMAALWPGIGEAFGMFLTRLMGGMLDVVTSPVPFPNGWKPLLDE